MTFFMFIIGIFHFGVDKHTKNCEKEKADRENDEPLPRIGDGGMELLLKGIGHGLMIV